MLHVTTTHRTPIHLLLARNTLQFCLFFYFYYYDARQTDEALYERRVSCGVRVFWFLFCHDSAAHIHISERVQNAIPSWSWHAGWPNGMEACCCVCGLTWRWHFTNLLKVKLATIEARTEQSWWWKKKTVFSLCSRWESPVLFFGCIKQTFWLWLI